MISTLVLSATVLLSPQVSRHRDADTVRLTDGKQLTGRVLYDDDEGIVMRIRKKQREIPHSEIQELRTLERSLKEWLDRYDQIAPIANQKDLLSQLPNAELELFEGGHGFYREDPRAYELIIEFLQRTE